MSRRVGVLLIGVAIAAVLGVYAWRRPGGAPDAGAPPSGPIRPTNVILISIDTLRADHLGAYGYAAPTSPSIDQLAADSVLYKDAFAHAPATLMSHASILTSRIPSHHNASYSTYRAVAPEATTLAELFKDAGHRTIAVTGGGQLAAAYGLDQGFDSYDELTPMPVAVDTAVAQIDRDRSRPFFLFFHTYAVHHPYAPPPAALAAFPTTYRGPIGDAVTVEQLEAINGGRRQITDADRAQIVRAYDGCIRTMDTELGRLLAAIKSRGLYDDALIVLTSDHGEEFNDHGQMGWHGHTLYDELLRVPLTIKWPGGTHRGTTVATAARGIDIAPTILAILGAGSSSFEGVVLPPLAAPAGEDTLLAVRREPLGNESREADGLRTREWKFDGARLFDLRVDAAEKHDVAAARPQVVRALLAALDTLNAGPADRPRTFTPNRELLERLRSLGYTGR